MIRLDRDLLFEIAKNLLLIQKTNKQYFAEISNVENFMLVDRHCKGAFLSQFSLVESFCFVMSDMSTLIISGCENKTDFRGNFVKYKWFMSLLIQYRKFNPKELVLMHVLKGKAEGKQRKVSLKGKSEMECLSALCKLDEGGLNLADYNGPKLRLSIFEVKGGFNLLVSLDNILGLNSTVTKVNVYFDQFHCLPETVDFSFINSPRIESLELTFNSEWDHDDDNSDQIFPASEWIELLSYAINSCPNLKNLCLIVSLHKLNHSSYNIVFDRLYKAMKAMMHEVLPKIMKEQCFLQVKFNAFVSSIEFSEFQNSEHKLLRLGIHRVNEIAGEVCSVIATNDCLELSFSIFDLGEPLFTDLTSKYF